MNDPKLLDSSPQELTVTPTKAELVSTRSRAEHLRKYAFPKGVSANPGGRTKELAAVQKAARSHGKEAIETLVKLMRSGPPKVQALAAMALLDRGFGKAPLTIEGNGSSAVVGVIILPPEES